MQLREEEKDGVFPDVQSPFPVASIEAAFLQHIFEDHCVGAVCDSQIFHFFAFMSPEMQAQMPKPASTLPGFL